MYVIVSSFYFSCFDLCFCEALTENHSCLGIRLETPSCALCDLLVLFVCLFFKSLAFPQNFLNNNTHIMECRCHLKAAFHKVLTISALSVLLHHSHDSSKARKEQFAFSG